MFALKLLLFYILIYFSWQSDNSDVFCSKSFCKTYKVMQKCPEIPKVCKIQNTTHNGIFLPFHGPCNCCDYCLENLNKGDRCVSGSVSGGLAPKTVCGDALACAPSGNEYTCQDIKTKCTEKRNAYDDRRKKGQSRYMELRPQCDRDGNFMPTVCTPGQTCFCISEDGDRLFGEAPYKQQSQLFMSCGCSRAVHKANKLFDEYKYSLLRPRCQPDGSFDTLQCVNNTCVCVDAKDAYPDLSTKANVLLVDKENFPCFDEENHVFHGYLRSCENEYKKVLDQVEAFEKEGLKVISMNFPNCQLDGRYAPVQEDENTKFCVDPNRNILNNTNGEEFRVPKNDILATTMNCKCARASTIITGLEKPACCENGNYKTMQCLRGLCRCVNGDGLQIEKEVEYDNIDKLTCKEDDCTV